MDTKKNWWAPVWRGLVVDPEAKHYRRMKNALWLFLFLILHADRRTGQLTRKTKTISGEMGVSSETIRKWLRRLREEGYVEVRRNGRSLEIGIKLWKTTRKWPDLDTQNGKIGPVRPVRNGHSEGALNGAKALDLGQGFGDCVDPNDISIKRNRNNDIIEDENFSAAFKRREELVAQGLAEALNDQEGLPFYLACARRYPEEHLRRVLRMVMAMPDEKIKKSRGALFNHLVQSLGAGE